MKDLISVIVPVYNTGKYLRRCVESIVAQDYPYIEIILVDDGSNDRSTVALCDTLAEEYSNVTAYHKPNGGQSSARNYGIRNSNGAYIGFVDSDDVIETGMYSSLYRSIVAGNVKVAIGGISVEYESGEVEILDVLPSGLYANKELMHHFFLGHFHSSCTNLYERGIFDTARFPENEINEDYMLNYLIFKYMDSVCFDGGAYYHYIKRNDSTTGSPVSLKFESWIRHTSRILEDYKNTDLGEEAEYQYLHSNVVLGNKCLLGLVCGSNADAETLYDMVSDNLGKFRNKVMFNRYFTMKNRCSAVMMSVFPGLYRTLVLFVLRLKHR